jgi:hypothetical protein
MIAYQISPIRKVYLNSFQPLCRNTLGQQAIARYHFSPFIDGSCRREPDLQHDLPSISSLCRAGTFAPQLYPGDIIVYQTVKRNWNLDFPHNRLVAILEVTDRMDSHESAAEWYRDQGYRLPSNCMVRENPPLPFDQTAGNFDSAGELQAFLAEPPEAQTTIGRDRIIIWNGQYRKRSRTWGTFLATKIIYRELINPPALSRETLVEIFGDPPPNTQRAQVITIEQLRALMAIAGIVLQQ